MNQEDKEFSPNESIQLIQKMIDTTKHSISDGSHYFLLWGWMVMSGCLLQYILMVFVNYEKHYQAWLVIPVALLIHFLFFLRDKKGRQVKTFIGEAYGHLWMAIGISFFGISVYMTHVGWQHAYPIYIMMYGIGTFVSGGLLQFKPLQIGGALCFPLMIICVYVGVDLRILITALAVLISYIIPGHILRNRYNTKKTF